MTMKRKRPSNLSLNAHNRRRKRQQRSNFKALASKTYRNSFMLTRPCCTKTFNTPPSTQRKRHGSRSPYERVYSPMLHIPFQRTPLKPSANKKLRKSLIERFGELNNLSNSISLETECGFTKINVNCECEPKSVGNSAHDGNNIGVPIETNRKNDQNISGNSLSESINLNTKPEQAESLESHESVIEDYDDITVLWTSALAKLKAKGLDVVMLEFLKQVKTETIPLDNMALTLFTDVVKWYSCNSTCHMRYSRESKVFWKPGYRLFGGRFLHFMGGLKSHGQVVMAKGEKGYLTPTESEINCAVPTENVLRQFDPYGLGEDVGENAFSPGILSHMIQRLSDDLDEYSCCLTFDGKKLKQGLTPTTGDVDILGFENGHSLVQKRQFLEAAIKPYDELLASMKQTDGDYVEEINSTEQNTICLQLKKAIQTISADINELQVIRKKKEYAKLKLIERCGAQGWKNSKYVMAISSIIAYVYDIDEYLKMANSVLEEIIKCVACLTESSGYLVKGKVGNLLHMESYIHITHVDESTTREIKQRTSTWHERRNIAKVTGQYIYNYGLLNIALVSHQQCSAECKTIKCMTSNGMFYG